MMEITRHFTATTFIVHKDKTLLHLHKKLGKWLPVGGHIDRDELPHEAAIREIKEETGLDVHMYFPEEALFFNDAIYLSNPMHLLLENINQFHQHIDFIYYAKADNLNIIPENSESNLKWFTAEEIKKETIPDNVKILAFEALKILS